MSNDTGICNVCERWRGNSLRQGICEGCHDMESYEIDDWIRNELPYIKG